MKAIITFLLIFCVIVVFHEFGHFFFAKRSGILVREFAIGMVLKFLHILVRMVPFILFVSFLWVVMCVWLVGVKIQLRLKRGVLLA